MHAQQPAASPTGSATSAVPDPLVGGMARVSARLIAWANITRGTIAFTAARLRGGLLAGGGSAAVSAQEGNRGDG
jgi:hypothetical protein